MARPAAVLDILVNAQTGKASAELKKFERNLKSTERQASDTDKQIVSSDKNVKSFGGSVGEANQRVLGLKNAVGLVKFPAFIAGAGAAAQAVGALGAGAVGLTSALAPLSGLLAAYPALLGAMGQAAGVKALAGFDKLGGAVGGLNEKLDETTTEFKALSPEAQKFARSLNQAKGPVRDLQAAVQKPLFKGLNEGIDAAMENFPALQKVLKGTAGEMGRLAKEAGELVGSKGFGKDFESIGKSNTQLLGRLGDAGLNFANALRHVMIAAEPLIDFLGKGVVQFSEWIEAEAKAGRESGRMAEFFERTEKVVRQLVSIGGSLASAFLDIGHAARPLGESILKTLVQQAEKLSEWTSSNQGTLKAYFEDAKGPLAEAGKLVKDIVAGFFDLSQQKGLGSFISQIRKELLPAVLEMTKATTKQFGPVLIETLVELTKLLTNFVGSSGTLTLFVKMIGTAAEALNKLFESIPGLATAASSALAGFSIFKLLGLGGLTGAGAKGGLMTKIGTQLGTRFGTTFANAAGPVAAGLFASALAGAQVGKALDLGQSKIGEKIAEELDIGLKKAMQVEQWMKNHPGLSAPEAFDAMRDAAREARKDVLDDIDLLRNRWGASLGEIKRRTQENMRGIRQTMGTESMRSKIAVMNNFDAAVDAIKASMDAGKISAKQGAKAIHQVLIKQLRSYGIQDPEGFINRSEAETNTMQQLGQTGQQNNGGSGGGHMRGGIIAALAAGGMVPGSGSGDKVPLHIGGRLKAMVEPGEYVSVANKKATAALMMANDAVPRFQRGGQIPGATAGLHSGIMGLLNDLYANYGGSVSSGIRSGAGSLHATANAADYVPGDWIGASAAANSAGRSLLEGIYNPGVHGGSPVSWDTGAHVSPSFWGASTWGDHLDHIHLAVAEGVEAGVRGGAGAVAGLAEKVDLPRFMGTNGIGGLVATGLNKVAAGAEQQVNKKLAARTVSSGSLGATVPTGPVQQMAHAMVSRMWGEGQWPPFVSLEMAEAGWDPRAVNPSSGAAGLAQALPPSKYPPGAWPYQGPESARLQLQWMTGYIRDRYGDPASAWAFHQSHNWYKEGGILKLAKGSGGKGKNRDRFQPGTLSNTPDPLASPWAQTVAVGQTDFDSTASPWAQAFIGNYVPPKIKQMIEAYQGAIDLLNPKIAMAEFLSSWGSSEGGSSLGPMEIAEQLFLNQQLLANLEGMVPWLKKGIANKKTGPKAKKAMQDQLAALKGNGLDDFGVILNTKKKIDDLQTTDVSTELTEAQVFSKEYYEKLIREANLRTAVSQAQYKVFENFAGGFAGGGYIPQGKWGVVGESGPEVVGGPTSVAQAGGGEVSVVVNGDIINTPPGMQPVEVRGAKTIVQQGSRGYGRRPLGGAKGY